MRIPPNLWLPLLLVLLAVCGTATPPALAQIEVPNPCPDEDEYGDARAMVNNFLTNPDLSDARAATGTTGLDTSQVQVLGTFSDRSACQTLNDRYVQHTDNYDLTYFEAGNRYFATLILKQPDEPNRFVSGIAIIVVLDSNLNKIESYGG